MILMHSHCQATAFEQKQIRSELYCVQSVFSGDSASYDISRFENMSLTPSYKGETASASPESPREGDFSSRQFYDNFRSLEEHETCDNKRGPIVNKVPDNYSGFPLKAQICALLLTNDLENVCAAPFGGCCSESNILLEVRSIPMKKNK